MREWREELQRAPETIRKPIAPLQPHLCSCKAAMKGKWLNGVYTCIKCNKPVYA